MNWSYFLSCCGHNIDSGIGSRTSSDVSGIGSRTSSTFSRKSGASALSGSSSRSNSMDSAQAKPKSTIRRQTKGIVLVFKMPFTYTLLYIVQMMIKKGVLTSQVNNIRCEYSTYILLHCKSANALWICHFYIYICIWSDYKDSRTFRWQQL